MQSIRILSAVAFALIVSLAARNDIAESAVPEKDNPRQYGPAQTLGNGTVRTYVTVNSKNPRVPVEIGVALSEAAMDNLPKASAPAAGHEGHAPDAHHMQVLELPSRNPTPYKYVQFNWNPAGHEPPGVYDLAHFDFHFFRVPVDVQNSIVPSNPEYATKAAAYPAENLWPAFYIDASKAASAPPAAVSVPLMGIHWLDVRSQELQGMAGKPDAFKPFTKTYIYGSWDGEFIFDEPMITRAYIMAKKETQDPAVRDEVVPISAQPKYAVPGFYPTAYRITYDATAKEYRVALTRLVKRD